MVMPFLASASFASALQTDVRIIVIDNDLYARIENREQRLLAVEDMLADIRMFEKDSPSRLATVVLYRDGSDLRKVRDLVPGLELADALNNHRLINEIRKGASMPNVPGFSVYTLRDRVWAIAKKYKLKRDRGVQRQIDLHVFGNTWLTESSSTIGGMTGNMQTYNFPGACYAQQDSSTREWPDHITLAVEFRPPNLHENPSPSAQFGMMTILAGSSRTNGQVKMRGEQPAGPTCPMGDLRDFTDPDGNTNVAIVCTAPEYRTPSDDLALRCGLPIAPTIGLGLDQNPIHLVARDTSVQLDRYTLSASGSGFDMIISTGVNGPTLLPGQNRTLPASVQGTYSATLEISPQSGCVPTSALTAILTSGQAEIQFVGANAGCTTTRINLHEVTIR